MQRCVVRVRAGRISVLCKNQFPPGGTGVPLNAGRLCGMGILPMRELRIMGKMPMPREKSQQLHKTEMRPGTGVTSLCEVTKSILGRILPGACGRITSDETMSSILN